MNNMFIYIYIYITFRCIQIKHDNTESYTESNSYLFQSLIICCIETITARCNIIQQQYKEFRRSMTKSSFAIVTP